MTALRVGLIGYGFAGATFHAPLIVAVEGLRLARIASSNAEKARRDHPQAVISATPQELLAAPDVDLVVIATPNAAHHALAREALQAGKHVVVEKPFTLNTAEADELVQLAASRQRMLSVFHNRRWDGDFLTVKQQIESGALGEINTFCSNMDRYRPHVRVRWREQDVPGSGTLYDLGSHLIDQALVLFGTPLTVMADVGAQRPGSPAVDYFHIVLGYGARRVILHSGSVVAKAGPRFQVHGSLGSVMTYGTDPQEDALKLGLRPGDTGWGVDPQASWAEVSLERDGKMTSTPVETLPGAYQAYYQGVVKAVRGEGSVPVNAQEARNVVKLIECATRSSREQRVVAFE